MHLLGRVCVENNKNFLLNVALSYSHKREYIYASIEVWDSGGPQSTLPLNAKRTNQ